MNTIRLTNSTIFTPLYVMPVFFFWIYLDIFSFLLIRFFVEFLLPYLLSSSLLLSSTCFFLRPSSYYAHLLLLLVLKQKTKKNKNKKNFIHICVMHTPSLPNTVSLMNTHFIVPQTQPYNQTNNPSSSFNSFPFRLLL